MENVHELRRAAPHSWIVTLASLLPLWLLAIAVMREGFPHPPISTELAIASFVISIAAGIVLVLKRWMAVEF